MPYEGRVNAAGSMNNRMEGQGAAKEEVIQYAGHLNDSVSETGDITEAMMAEVPASLATS